MIINPKNVTITGRALEVLSKSVPNGRLSAINDMRLVPIMLYTYGVQYTDQDGRTIRRDNANYLMGQIRPDKLEDEIIIELSANKFIAVRFEFPFSDEKTYTIDFDGEHLIVY